MSNPERDARLANRARSEDRAGREESDRSLTEDRQVMDADRLEQFRQLFVAERLPRLPPIKGYHVCWLTTTNPNDPIYRRVAMGYQPIKASEIPGFESAQIKGGEYEGCIGCAEMIAFKLPLELYKLYMTEVHYTQPLAEEGKLRAVIDVIQREAANKKARVDVEEGTSQLGQRPPPPKFEGVT